MSIYSNPLQNHLRQIKRRIFYDSTSVFLASFSFAGWCLIALYGIRPNTLSALTLYPAWLWLFPPLLILALIRKKYIYHRVFLIGTFLVYGALFVEEPLHFFKGVHSPPQYEKPDGAIRLITFNCLGQGIALDEIRVLQPDFVFLQESPTPDRVSTFAREFSNTEALYIQDFDTAIIAPGESLEKIEVELALSFCTIGILTTPTFGKIQLVSLRLKPSMPRIDLWNPKCWIEQKRTREIQLEQINGLLGILDTTMPTIIGGDFNVPQGDPVFSVLRRHFYDAYRSGGRGIGNTILNDFPVLRIDQIWLSKDFETIQSFVQKSSVSDHRMVVCDIAGKE